MNLESSATMLQSVPVMPKQTIDSLLSPLGGSLIGAPLKQGDKFEFTLAPAPTSDNLELKITMVYNDLPARAIQNNLNLAVNNSVTGVTKHGGISKDDIDVQNNVEQVIWYPAPTVPVTVRVTAQKIFALGGEQDFVLAWSISAPFQGVNENFT